MMHAVCDAVLGALGEGDIGHFFSNADPRWKNAPSKVFLQEAARQVAFHSAKIVNVDSTVIAQAPKLGPHIHPMQLNISQALGINPKRDGIKATTNEQLGFLGREEGIAAMAVAGGGPEPGGRRADGEKWCEGRDAGARSGGAHFRPGDCMWR